MKRRARIFALIALPALSGGAQASPACIYQDAALRGGPGSSYYLIGTIPAPARVTLLQLKPQWSMISYDGETGYVATAHLSPYSGARPDPPAYAQSLAPGRALTREIDPFFGDASLRGRFDWRPGALTPDYFSGYRRTPWTDRTPTGEIKPLSSAGCSPPVTAKPTRQRR